MPKSVQVLEDVAFYFDGKHHYFAQQIISVEDALAEALINANLATLANSRWNRLDDSVYTVTPANTNTLTFSDTSSIRPGMPIRYKYNDNTYYGIIHTVAADTSITIEGVPFNVLHDIQWLEYGDSELIHDGSIFLFSGGYAAEVSTDLWNDINGTDIEQEADLYYLVGITVKHDSDDTGTVTTQPTVNIDLGSGDVFTSPVEVGVVKGRTGVTVDPARYAWSKGDSMRITLAKAAGASPADDADTMQLQVIFVKGVD